MEQISIICRNCGNGSIKLCNPEIPTNKFTCTKCGDKIIVRFDDDEMQMWAELEDLEEND